MKIRTTLTLLPLLIAPAAALSQDPTTRPEKAPAARAQDARDATGKKAERVQDARDKKTAERVQDARDKKTAERVQDARDKKTAERVQDARDEKTAERVQDARDEKAADRIQGARDKADATADRVQDARDAADKKAERVQGARDKKTAERVQDARDKADADAGAERPQGARDKQEPTRVGGERVKGASKVDGVRNADAEGNGKGKGKAAAAKGLSPAQRNATLALVDEIRTHEKTLARIDKLAAIYQKNGDRQRFARVETLRTRENARYEKTIGRYEILMGKERYSVVRRRLESAKNKGAKNTEDK